MLLFANKNHENKIFSLTLFSDQTNVCTLQSEAPQFKVDNIYYLRLPSPDVPPITLDETPFAVEETYNLRLPSLDVHLGDKSLEF